MLYIVVVFYKQKTAYEMRISDWSSDVCSSDLSCERQCAGHSRFRLPRLYGHLDGEKDRGGLQRHLAGGSKPLPDTAGDRNCQQIGRASGRERVCKYV